MVKIGPIEIRRARSEKPPAGEMGSTGTEMFGSLLGQTDYNATLQGPTGYAEYDKMRLSDGQVKAVLTVLKLPLLNADWYVEPASDAPQDREIAERLHIRVREGMSVSWQALLRQILLHLDYGSMPFEPVWVIEDGLVMLRKLAPRLPASITEWILDEKGGLAGVKQSASTGSGWKEVTIPIRKLVIFVNELEGSNWRGVSVLRAAYKHWYYKQGLERVQAIAIEKRAMGVDHGILQGDAITDEKKREYERVLMGLHTHEKGFLVTTEGQTDYKLEGFTGGTASVLDPQGAIDYHNLSIVRSCIAEFIAMGSGSTGSLAMHKDKTSLLMLGLGAVANNIADTVSQHLIRPWVDYNWAVTKYPRMRYSHLEARDLTAFAEAVVKFRGAGVLDRRLDVRNAARQMLDLEALSEEPEEEEPEEPMMGGLAEMPTEEAVAAVRMLRAELRRRRENDKSEVVA